MKKQRTKEAVSAEQAEALKAIEETPETPFKPVNLTKPKFILGIPRWKFIRNKLLENQFPSRKLTINMELRNGRHRTIQIHPKNSTFKFQGSMYVIDHNLAYDNIDCKTLMLDYHQDFCLPLKRCFNLKDIQDAIDEMGNYEIETATNPAVLRKLVEADIGGNIAKAVGLPDALRKLLWLGAISAIGIIIMIIIFVIKTGMLKDVHVPGIN